MIFNLECQRKKDYIRYIKHNDTKALADFENKGMKILLDDIAAKLGYVTDNGEIKYKNLKEYIIGFIDSNYNNINVSKRQIAKMLRPRKDVCSKYAPIVAMAIFDIIAIQKSKDLLQKIPKEVYYPEFIFGDILNVITPADDRLVVQFNTCLSNIRYILRDDFYQELCQIYNEGESDIEENNKLDNRSCNRCSSSITSSFK